MFLNAFQTVSNPRPTVAQPTPDTERASCGLSKRFTVSDLIAKHEGPTFIFITVAQRRLDRRYS